MKNLNLVHKITAIGCLFIFLTAFSFAVPSVNNSTTPNATALEEAPPMTGCSAADALAAVKADADVRKCARNAPPAPYRLNASITPLGPCPQGGSSWEVYVYAEIPCVNPPFCPLAPIVLVARVIVDCNCNVTLVDCYV